MAGVHGADLRDVQVVQGHQQLGSQRAVVDVARAQEERAQELQHHVVELHVLPDHLGQLQHHLRQPDQHRSHGGCVCVSALGRHSPPPGAASWETG